REVLPAGCMPEMSRVAHAISEVTNVTPATHQPYVGHSAFAHKGGLHASAVKIDPMLYQHIDPAEVGNDMRMLVSDMAGRASVELLLRDEIAGERLRHFTVESWRAIVEQDPDGRVRSEATVKVHAGGERII